MATITWVFNFGKAPSFDEEQKSGAANHPGTQKLLP
jgi:hypothetical protein